MWEGKERRWRGRKEVQWNRASKLVAMRATCALSGGCSSKALGSRMKFHRRRRHHSVGRFSATASSFRVMWKGVPAFRPDVNSKQLGHVEFLQKGDDLAYLHGAEKSPVSFLQRSRRRNEPAERPNVPSLARNLDGPGGSHQPHVRGRNSHRLPERPALTTTQRHAILRPTGNVPAAPFASRG